MKHIILLFTIPLISYCQTKTELDGIWVGAYKITESNSNYRNHNVGPYIIEFENGKCTTTYFDYNETGVAHSYSVDSFNYKVQNNLLINESDKNSEVLEIKSNCSDSLVIGFQDVDDVVLKKVKINESPSVNILNRAFTLKVGDFIDSIDFINDTTFLHIGDVNEFQEDRWSTFKHKGISLLILYGHRSDILFIDDVRQNSIKLKLYRTKEYDVELQGISNDKEIETLYGTWKEISTKVSGEIYNPPLPPGVNETDRKWKLTINPDSLELSRFNRNRKLYWTTNSTNQFIIIPHYYKSNHVFWKVVELTDEHLKIKKLHEPWNFVEFETKDFKKIKKADNNGEHAGPQ